ncbi:MAG: ATP-binding cassette domain-containing protein [Pseudomonadota bacterium]
MLDKKTPSIDVSDLTFSYADKTILNIPQFTLDRASSVAVIGPSGCGKTTFLHLLAGLIRPNAGRIEVLGQRLDELKAASLDRFRGRHIGLVFQRLHLLPALNVRDNVLLAQRLSGSGGDAGRVAALFDQLELSGLEHRMPSMLSQGQAQRVAIARALVHGPELIMADEPTSALDDGHAERALALLQSSARSVGAALLVVTHDQRVRGRLDGELDLEVAP